MQREARSMVTESKLMAEAGFRVDPESRSERPYYCRTCGHTVMSLFVPVGWLALTIHMGKYKSHRLGLFCSIACLEVQIPRIKTVGHNLGDTWIEDTEPMRAPGDK